MSKEPSCGTEEPMWVSYPKLLQVLPVQVWRNFINSHMQWKNVGWTLLV